MHSPGKYEGCVCVASDSREVSLGGFTPLWIINLANS